MVQHLYLCVSLCVCMAACIYSVYIHIYTQIQMAKLYLLNILKIFKIFLKY